MKLISDLDGDGSGTTGLEVSFKMFTHRILNRDPEDELLKAIRLLGDHQTGKISFKNLKLIQMFTTMAAAPLAWKCPSGCSPTKS